MRKLYRDRVLDCSAIRMFSQTDRAGKIPVIRKDLPMPICEILKGGSPVILFPLQ